MFHIKLFILCALVYVISARLEFTFNSYESGMTFNIVNQVRNLVGLNNKHGKKHHIASSVSTISSSTANDIHRSTGKYVSSIIAGFGANDILHAPGLSLLEDNNELQRFNSPRYTAVDSRSNMYVTVEDSKHYLKKLSLTSGKIEMFGSANEDILSSVDEGHDGVMRRMGGIAIDPADNIYIVDFFNCVIRYMDTAKNTITIYAGVSGECNYSGDDGAAQHARLNGPSDIALDSIGFLYIADTGNGVIRKVDTSSNIITTYFGSMHSSYSGIPSCPTSSNILKISSNDVIMIPYALATDHDGNLYIGDNKCSMVIKVTPEKVGVVITGAGDMKATSKIYAKDAGFDVISSISYDDTTNTLYITDKLHNVVYALHDDTIEPWIGSIESNSVVQVDLKQPHSVAIDQYTRALYIANTASHNIVKVAESK